VLRRVSLILVAFATLAVLIVLADIELLFQVLNALPVSTLALLLGIFLAGSVLKSFRWAFYLRSAQLDIRWRDGLTSFLAGMTTSPLPGGSWLAPRLAQEHGHVRMRQAAPALFVSFIADALTLPLTVLALFVILDQPSYSFAIPAIGIALGLVMLAMGRSTRVWNLVARLLDRTRFTRGWLPKERDIQRRVQALMRPRVLLGGIAFSLGATLLSAAFMMTLVVALTFRGITPGEALWVHTVSETASIAIPIPGGFGVTDSSIAGLLNQYGIGLQRATFLALVLRSSEAGFRVFFGSLVLFVRYDRFLLNVLDLRGRTRGAYKHACKVPGVRQAFGPVVNALRTRFPRSIATVSDSPPIEKPTLSD